MMLAIDNLPHELLLGRQTENGVTVISIDVQSWLEQSLDAERQKFLGW